MIVHPVLEHVDDFRIGDGNAGCLFHPETAVVFVQGLVWLLLAAPMLVLIA